MLRLLSAVLGAALLLMPLTAIADDWIADKLRGRVLQYIDDTWQPLSRGMPVPDSRIIRTTASGHVTLVRGDETVEVGPGTQIAIHDKAGRKPYTTVTQYFGSLSVEAEVRNVQHFAVDTPFLAAVVKGTRFTVTSDETGSSVGVRRGHVAVEDLHTHHRVLLSAGQTATVPAAGDEGIAVGGKGKLPAVTDSSGKVVPPAPDGLRIDIGRNLLHAGVGSGGATLDVGGVAHVDVGGGSLVSVDVGGSGNPGPSGGGGLLNLTLGGLHLGL